MEHKTVEVPKNYLDAVYDQFKKNLDNFIGEKPKKKQLTEAAVQAIELGSFKDSVQALFLQQSNLYKQLMNKSVPMAPVVVPEPAPEPAPEPIKTNIANVEEPSNEERVI